MRRPLLLTIAALSIVLAAATPAAAHKGSIPPAKSNAFGASLLTWEKRWVGWAFGSSTNPLMSDTCGEKVGKAFFLNANATDQPFLDVTCHLRPGTRLVGSPAGAVAWAPTDGQTRQELFAARDSFFSGTSDPRATLDGHSLGSLDDALRLTDVYTIELENGNFIQSVDPGVPGDQTRVASGGWFVRIRPLPRGHHVLVLSARIDGDRVGIRFHIKVGHCGRAHGG